MYLFLLKILICSNSWLKFVKSFIVPYNAVNSDCIIKDIYRDFHFVFCLQIYALAGQTMNFKLFLCCSLFICLHLASLHILLIFSFIQWQPRALICKQNTQISL